MVYNPASPIVPKLMETGGRTKPVITSNQATFWRSLRTVGINDRIEGFGSLLTDY